jgi:hypothetical protein
MIYRNPQLLAAFERGLTGSFPHMAIGMAQFGLGSAALSRSFDEQKDDRTCDDKSTSTPLDSYIVVSSSAL